MFVFSPDDLSRTVEWVFSEYNLLANLLGEFAPPQFCNDFSI